MRNCMLKVSTEEINTAQSRDDDGDVTGVTVVEQGEASRDSDNNDEDDELERERERWRPRAIFRGGLTRQHCTIANDANAQQVGKALEATSAYIEALQRMVGDNADLKSTLGELRLAAIRTRLTLREDRHQVHPRR